MALMPVEEALSRILANVRPLPSENVALDEALGRVLARPVSARRNQPPFNASAMDGYAVMADDVTSVPVSLTLAGVSAAGHGFAGRLKSGQCVRILTGAPLPRGADTVVIQENVRLLPAGVVQILEGVRRGQNVRPAGLDFRRGDVLLPAGLTLSARDLGLAAAANAARPPVCRKPVIAIFATGDELVLPGTTPGASQIISSNSHALEAMAASFGARIVNFGIVRDQLKATERIIAKASNADILLTTGGASVGDHDYVQEALRNAGVDIAFWKIAMRPGKPFMYGRRKRQHVLGLPGNPVSALVCARLFLVPLIRCLLGQKPGPDMVQARLGSAMKANDGRQDYVRARLSEAADGTRTVTPFPVQDSSMQRTFREADALIVRPPNAPAATEGDVVDILRLDF